VEKLNLPRIAKAVVITLLLAATVFLIIDNLTFLGHSLLNVGSIAQLIRKSGAWGPLILVLLHITQNVIFFIPGSFVSIAGGFVYGAVFGFIYNLIGIMVGTTVLFFLARWLGRAWVETHKIGCSVVARMAF
jgi:uncharacterized membrane protein YdjX (TVP38/TMEM64 family)